MLKIEMLKQSSIGAQLSSLVNKDQLSLTLQGNNTTVQEAVQVSKLAVHFQERQRTDDAFDAFYFWVLNECKDFTDEPTLPRQRTPKRVHNGSRACTFDSQKLYSRKAYFEVLDKAGGELQHRFQQKRGMPVAAALKKSY